MKYSYNYISSLFNYCTTNKGRKLASSVLVSSALNTSEQSPQLQYSTVGGASLNRFIDCLR